MHILRGIKIETYEFIEDGSQFFVSLRGPKRD